MSEISKSIQFICDEKGLNYDTVLEAVESALGAAFRKDFGTRQGNYKVQFDVETGDMKVWDVKIVVEDVEETALEAAQEEMQKRREKAVAEGRDLTEEEVADLPRFNPKTDLMLAAAKEFKKSAKIGDTLEIPQEVPGDFGRMAAQTAKQVIIQKLREAERQTVFDDFKNQEGKIVQGTVQRRDRTGMVIIDLGKITGILPQNEQIQREMYRPGVRMRFYVIAVALGMRGPEIVLSRAHKNMVSVIFEQEIPEIASGDVVIRTIARDPGNRSKVAVSTDDESIDPIGSCIGQRGSRINTIIQELGGEKIDIIEYKENGPEFIKMALAPAKISRVEIDEKEKKANAFVVADQFSLAIGRGGQNVRLAAELTGWGINVVEEGNEEKVVSDSDDPEVVQATLATAGEEVPAEESVAEEIVPEEVVETAPEEKTEE